MLMAWIETQMKAKGRDFQTWDSESVNHIILNSELPLRKTFEECRVDAQRERGAYPGWVNFDFRFDVFRDYFSISKNLELDQKPASFPISFIDPVKDLFRAAWKLAEHCFAYGIERGACFAGELILGACLAFRHWETVKTVAIQKKGGIRADELHFLILLDFLVHQAWAFINDPNQTI